MKSRFLAGALSGLLVGAIIFGGSSAVAAVQSLVGAKVSGIYTVNKSDGTKVADGAVINGSAYVPVRAVSEAVGIPLRVEGKTITIETIVGQNDAISPEILDIINVIGSKEADIISWQGLINIEQASLKMYEESRVTALEHVDEAPFITEGIDENIAKTKARIAEYQAQIDAAEAEITKLQAQVDALSK